MSVSISLFLILQISSCKRQKFKAVNYTVWLTKLVYENPLTQKNCNVDCSSPMHWWQYAMIISVNEIGYLDSNCLCSSVCQCPCFGLHDFISVWCGFQHIKIIACCLMKETTSTVTVSRSHSTRVLFCEVRSESAESAA